MSLFPHSCVSRNLLQLKEIPNLSPGYEMLFNVFSDNKAYAFVSQIKS